MPAAAPAPAHPSYSKKVVERAKTVKSKRMGQAKAFDQSLIQRNAAPSVSEPAKSKPISGWKHFDKSEAFNLNSLR